MKKACGQLVGLSAASPSASAAGASAAAFGWAGSSEVTVRAGEETRVNFAAEKFTATTVAAK